MLISYVTVKTKKPKSKRTKLKARAKVVAKFKAGYKSRLAKTKAKPKLTARDKRRANGYRLTVASDKIAVLLRLPKTVIDIIDGMAKGRVSRTRIIYDILSDHPRLRESMRSMSPSFSGYVIGVDSGAGDQERAVLVEQPVQQLEPEQLERPEQPDTRTFEDSQTRPEEVTNSHEQQ